MWVKRLTTSRRAIRMDSCENQMASQCGLNSNFRRVTITNFADHDQIWVVPQY